MTRFANRTQELQLFNQMLRRDVRERILLIEAPSGYGKTGLMGRFELLCSSEIYTVLVDLKAAQTGISYVFYKIQCVLGKKRFPNFEKEIANFLNSGVEIKNNRLSGEGSQIQVILEVPPGERQYRLTQLQQVFFEDLQNFNRPILFIFDTFNGATEELAIWIEGQFVTEVALNPNLLAIVAGQNIPQPTIEWLNYHHCCRLGRIIDREAWYLYSKEVGYPFEPKEINILIDAVGGVPAKVVELLETAARTRQQA
jgi:hypothetical protein